MNSLVKLKNIGWITLGLCGLCCTLPIIGVFLGIGVLSGVTMHLEQLSMGILLVSILIFLFIYNKKKKTVHSCGIDCKCKTVNRQPDII